MLLTFVSPLLATKVVIVGTNKVEAFSEPLNWIGKRKKQRYRRRYANEAKIKIKRDN